MMLTAWVAVDSCSSPADGPYRLNIPRLICPTLPPPPCCCPAGLRRRLHGAAARGEAPDAARGGASARGLLPACLPGCQAARLPACFTAAFALRMQSCGAGGAPTSAPLVPPRGFISCLPCPSVWTCRSMCKQSGLEESSWRRSSSLCPSGWRCMQSSRRSSRAWWVAGGCLLPGFVLE